MKIAKKSNLLAKLLLAILLVALLLITTQPITIYAAENNPEHSILEAFPTVGISSDTMQINLGTINILYGGGIVKENKGTISSSRGTVAENFGLVEELSAGHVGTNYGTINIIENTGLLTVNDDEGTVLFVATGNEIERNDGVIQENYGKISQNYGKVDNNCGTVIMHDGQIVKNSPNGKVSFEAKIVDDQTIPAKGTIDNNEGSVEVNSGNITIKENTGDIVINNATVNVEKNSGNITVGSNATLNCNENQSGGVITKKAKSAVVVCNSNEGIINDETTVKYKIVFAGDDGQAIILECDYKADGVCYTEYEGAVIFTLPKEYACKSAMLIEPGNENNTWWLIAYPEDGSTEFTIVCHQCFSDEYKMSADKHWQECEECGRTINEDAHTTGDYISDNNSTCCKDGTETYSCTECGYRHTRTVIDSHLTSNNHEHVVIDPRVEPTETSTGLTQGSHCEGCHEVLIAQEIIPKIPQKFVPPSGYPHDESTQWKNNNLNIITGDDNHIFLWFAIIFVSGGVFVGTTVYVKKRTNTNIFK